MEEKEIQDHHSIQELVEVVLQRLDKIHNHLAQVVEVEQEEHLQSQDHVYHLVVVAELELVQEEPMEVQDHLVEVVELDNLIQDLLQLELLIEVVVEEVVNKHVGS